ncbi:S-layer homology domain-containing protein [Paenibacillus sp. MBLB4367]|uniref:S-layer homology domain-containing protein n=1 Tax=Paenibacillus sp. MBLB4367 TaxID=3384767 RepID=UPI0039082486
MKTKLLRSWTSMFVVAALLLTLLPAFPQKAAAAATFFYPDNPGLAQKANPADNVAIDRNSAYVSNTKTLDITGTYQSVSADSLVVKVEQLVKKDAGWVVDPLRTFTKGINALPNNRFEASRIQLFAGFNKVTLLGKQNGVEKYDIFYVLYDDIPYLKTLKIGTGTVDPVDLNEGVSRIIPKPSSVTDPNYKMVVYLQGQAQNATKVSVNGSVTTPIDDGSFFAPPITLTPGKNEIEVIVENDTNRVVSKRSVYYYDPLKPYIDLQIQQQSPLATNPNPVQSLLGTDKPKLTDSTTAADLTATIITPYSATGKAGDFAHPTQGATVTTHVYEPTLKQTYNGGAGLTVNKETIVPGDDGEPAYKIIEFKVSGYNIPNSSDKETKIFDLAVDYGTFHTRIPNLKYNYYPGDIVIKKATLVEIDTKGNADPADDVFTEKAPLNGSEVTSPDFYIQLETSVDEATTTGKELSASLLPIGTATLTVEGSAPGKPVKIITDGTTKKYIYKIKGLPNGSQKVQFIYKDSLTGYEATINYVSKRYIYVEGVYDGQTVTFDSSDTTGQKTVNISGEFVGFDSLLGEKLTINGKEPGLDTPGNAADDFKVDPVTHKFTYTMQFANATNPDARLYFGENTIVLTGTDTTGGMLQTIRKEIKIYIIDKNMPVLTKFQPLEIPTTGSRPVLDSTIFTKPLTSILFKNDRYVTSLKEYDLVFNGGGAEEIKLMRGGELILHAKTDGTILPGTTPNAELYKNDGTHVGSGSTSSNFLFRITNLKFDAPGSQVYTLELKNSTGARITQRLEIQREVAPYRILAPQPTVGDRILVNKNFVRFDIEAEGAEQVLIDGKAATKRPDFNDRFIYEYSGLKANKETIIKVAVVRQGGTLNTTVKVYYTDSVQIGSQFMEKIGSKHNVFGGDLQLAFPKGTILKTADPTMNQNQVTQFYDQTQLMFGIADPTNGMVERINDYGNRKGLDVDLRTDARNGQYAIPILDWLSQQFTSPSTRQHFTAVSPFYWISGGVGEQSVKGSSNYRPATNGLDPYDIEGTFTTFLPERKIVPSERGSLTLQFDKNVVDIAGTQITVFYFNDRGEWSRLGGVVDTKKNTVTVPFDDFGYYVVMKLREGFADITNHPWARNVLEALFAKGYMENIRYEDFGTDDFATRGEFATMLVKSLEIPINADNNNTFVDVVPGSRSVTWDYAHIETAARAGIITGMDNRWFGVNQRLTREQAATMIARALDLKVAVNDSKLLANLDKLYTDTGAMSYYALPFIEAVTKDGVMLGRPNELAEGEKKQTSRFDPLANLTRAEVGQIAVRLLQKHSKVFPKNLN